MYSSKLFDILCFAGLSYKEKKINKYTKEFQGTRRWKWGLGEEKEEGSGVRISKPRRIAMNVKREAALNGGHLLRQMLPIRIKYLF